MNNFNIESQNLYEQSPLIVRTKEVKNEDNNQIKSNISKLFDALSSNISKKR
jgi:hypothetical protein